jgi:hypothetical protein
MEAGVQRYRGTQVFNYGNAAVLKYGGISAKYPLAVIPEANLFNVRQQMPVTAKIPSGNDSEGVLGRDVHSSTLQCSEQKS